MQSLCGMIWERRAVRSALLLVVGLLLLSATVSAGEGERRKRAPVPGYWIRNDLRAGLKAARESGRPLLINYCCDP